jgi:UDP-N-acetylmuramate dehydrogenase
MFITTVNNYICAVYLILFMSIVQENISLKPYNTFGVAVRSTFFAEVFSPSALEELLKSALIKEQPLLILGGGK